MPFLVLAALAGIPSVALLLKIGSDEAQDTAEITLPQIVTIGAAGLGLYAAYRLMTKGRL